jgi:Zn-dependent protease
MALSAWAYAFYYGWPFAAGLVLLILIHEIGHGMAAARVGVRVGAPMFVPFVGAFIALRDRPRSTSDEAVIAAAVRSSAAAAAALTVAVSLSAGELLTSCAWSASMRWSSTCST